mmetsp:Transcript_3207/g.7098  ORF Transcript_3207/g.7098 Transcript_3207/m.7098 type:complete len:295 (-) Transcript_3207:716-1600(-)
MLPRTLLPGTIQLCIQTQPPIPLQLLQFQHRTSLHSAPKISYPPSWAWKNVNEPVSPDRAVMRSKKSPLATPTTWRGVLSINRVPKMPNPRITHRRHKKSQNSPQQRPPIYPPCVHTKRWHPVPPMVWSVSNCVDRDHVVQMVLVWKTQILFPKQFWIVWPKSARRIDHVLILTCSLPPQATLMKYATEAPPLQTSVPRSVLQFPAASQDHHHTSTRQILLIIIHRHRVIYTLKRPALDMLHIATNPPPLNPLLLPLLLYPLLHKIWKQSVPFHLPSVKKCVGWLHVASSLHQS